MEVIKDKIIKCSLGTLLLDEQTQEEICETLTPTKKIFSKVVKEV